MSEKNMQLILKAIDQVCKDGLPFTSKKIEELIGKTRNATSMLNYLHKRRIIQLIGKDGRTNVYDLVNGVSAVEAHRAWLTSPARMEQRVEPDMEYHAVPFLLASVRLTADNPRIRL